MSSHAPPDELRVLRIAIVPAARRSMVRVSRPHVDAAGTPKGRERNTHADPQEPIHATSPDEAFSFALPNCRCAFWALRVRPHAICFPFGGGLREDRRRSNLFRELYVSEVYGTKADGIPGARDQEHFPAQDDPA